MYRFSIYNSEIDDFWWDVKFRKTVICRLDSIGYGLLCAWIHYYYSNFWRNIKIPASILGLVLITIITNYDSSTNTIYKQTIYFSLIPFTAMLFIPIAESYKNGRGIISTCIQHISKISYSMYLINLALVAQIIDKNFTPNGGTDGLIKYLLYWLSVVLFSTLLYKYFEKPMMDLRDKKLIKLSLTKNKRH